MDEYNTVLARTGRHDPNAGPLFRFEDDFDAARLDVDTFDSTRVEQGAGQVTSYVIVDPAAIARQTPIFVRMWF